MANLETTSLNVINISPEAYSIDANIDSKINIYFNLDLDTSSIIGNVQILKDKNRIYNYEKDLTKLSTVEGTFTYSEKERAVIFIPKDRLEEDCRYLVFIGEKTVRDVYGRVLNKDYIRYFDTEGTAGERPTQIIFPKNNSINLEVNKIVLEDVGATKYLIQVSKIKTFASLVFEHIADNNEISLEDILKYGFIPDGTYFARAKSLNGDFGDIISFTVKSYKDTLPVDQDHSDDFFYEEIEVDEVTFEKFYPYDGEIEISEKTNAIYLTFDGEVDVNDIDFYESGIYGEFSDDEDYDEDSEPHGYLNVVYNIIYSEKENKTYIILTPDTL